MDEIQSVLDPEAAEQFAYAYDVSNEGNWEEKNILNQPKSMDQCAKLLGLEPAVLERSLAESRGKLLAVRSERVAPGRDDKILVSWNGLMIDAMAKAYQMLREQRYLDAARSAAQFILSEMWRVSTSDGSVSLLLHSFKDGRARFNGYLEDYANLIDSLVTLYESDFDPTWLRNAVDLAETMIAQFWDEPGGSFYYTGVDHEQLVARPRDAQDSSTPSGNAMAMTALIRLGRLTGKADYVAKSERALRSFANILQMPTSGGQLLVALELLLGDPVEIVLVPGRDVVEAERSLQLIRERFVPNKVVARAASDPEDSVKTLIPLLAHKTASDGHTSVFICKNFVCEAPVSGAESLGTALDRL